MADWEEGPDGKPGVLRGDVETQPGRVGDLERSAGLRRFLPSSGWCGVERSAGVSRSSTGGGGGRRICRSGG